MGNNQLRHLYKRTMVVKLTADLRREEWRYSFGEENRKVQAIRVAELKRQIEALPKET